jgi:hypothetical protein
MTRITLAILLALAAPALAQTALPMPKVGSCPSGFRESGGYCAPMTDRAPAAIPKGARQCPSGFAQSGAYCLQMRAR